VAAGMKLMMGWATQDGEQRKHLLSECRRKHLVQSQLMPKMLSDNEKQEIVDRLLSRCKKKS
jgi:3-methyladenine DNA glycosylase AlkC